jgi:hypothetical protein
LFIHLFKWPSHVFVLDGIKGTVKKAYMLADEQQNGLPFEQNGTHLSVKLAAAPPDPVDSVLVLEKSGEK